MESPKKKRKQKNGQRVVLVGPACNRCRRTKRGCDRKKPICDRCKEIDGVCIYADSVEQPVQLQKKDVPNVPSIVARPRLEKKRDVFSTVLNATFMKKFQHHLNVLFEGKLRQFMSKKAIVTMAMILAGEIRETLADACSESGLQEEPADDDAMFSRLLDEREEGEEEEDADEPQDDRSKQKPFRIIQYKFKN